MKRLALYLILPLLWLACSRNTSPTQNSRADDANYEPEGSILFRSKALAHDTSVRVFVEMDLKNFFREPSTEKLLSGLLFNYALLPEYGSKDVIARRNLKLTPADVKRLNANTFAFAFDVPKANTPNAVLFLEVTDVQASRKMLHDIPFRFTPARLGDSYAVFGQRSNFPHLRNYFFNNDTLRVADLKGSSRTLVVTRYAHDFEPAAPPMGAGNRNAPKTMSIDTTFQLRTNQPFVLTAPGLYLLREDTSQVQGMGILITNDRYPRFTNPNQLLKPLIYISTRNEIKEISSTNAPKKTLDTYWMRLASNNESKARRSIRAYYRRVTTANQLFTTYKEGWKTDMGMVYIVLGPPDQVTRSKDKEVWLYTQNANFSEINFTFMRRPNQFLDNSYELVRYVEYEPMWYPIVEEWRTGIVER